MNSFGKSFYMFLSFLIMVIFAAIGLVFINKASNDERFFLKQGLIKEATAHFDNMVVARHWNAQYGGVFVDQKEGIEPNPFLKNNSKLDADGNVMVKINPAWMTRQISELSNEKENYYYKITSLKPVNPANKPDKFEKKALEYFEHNKDKKYFYEFGEKFNFMGSLETTKACLKCHSYQGYKLGDIRGGIRVSVPTGIYNEAIKAIDKQELLYSIVVIVGTFILALMLYYIIRLLYIYKFQKDEIKAKDVLLSRAQNIASLGYWKLDHSDSSLSWSEEVYNIFELDPKKFEPSYEHFLELVHPDDKEMVNKEYRRSLKKCDNYEVTHRIQMKDGRIKYVRERCESIYGEDKNPIESIGIIIDVTKLQNAYDEMVEKDKIILAQSRHAAMGEMISMIAHQWRQPISAISMSASNIIADVELENIQEKQLKEDAQDIIKQTQELSETIDDFRDFFKPSKTVHKVYVKDIINESLGVIGKSLENNNINLSLELQDSNEIETYPRELMQVFISALQNSREAIVENIEEKRAISIRAEDHNGGVIVKICDNGGGVDEEIINKVFEPYFSTKLEKNGSGLGLYMSKTIINMHLHGTINISNEGDGACITVILPSKIES